MKAMINQIQGISVNCKKIAINPCALDEYEVIIKIKNLEYTIYTYGGLFESDKAVCDRVYKQWYNNIVINE